jgi:predicted nucleotidyltransferase
MNALIKNNIDDINRLCKKHHVKELFVFGSVTGESFDKNSDIDFLYQFDTSGIDFDNLAEAEYDYADNFFDLKTSLESLLGRKVDLIHHQPFRNPYFRDAVEKTKQLIYSDERLQKISV